MLRNTGTTIMAESWHYVCNSNEIELEDVKGVVLNGTPVAVHRLEAGVYATQNRCTHQLALLSRGFVFGDVIECPVHQGRFHIPTGCAIGSLVITDLQTFETKKENGQILVKIANKENRK